MGILTRLFGNSAATKADARPAMVIAREIVSRYQRRRAKPDSGVDDEFVAELCQHVPEPAVREIANSFQQRRAHGDAEAVHKLAVEITVAIHDARHRRKTARPIWVPAEQVVETADSQPASASRSYAKAAQGRPLTDEDEDAILFGDYLP
jgi:hypothetical protein